MSTIAGHTCNFGYCECGRKRSDINSAAREAIAAGRTLLNEEHIAHVGRVVEREWQEIIDDIEAEDRAFANAMASL